MKNRTYIFLIFAVIFCSCTRYNNSDYQNEEDKAIIDLIPDLVDADYMLKYNNYKTNKPTLYLIKELHGQIDTTYGEIQKSDIKLIKPLIDGTIPDRLLNDTIFNIYKNLDIKVISKNDYEQNHADNYPQSMSNDNNKILGYLWLSRVIINRKLDKGYLEFTFFCGDACAWGATIEIKKVNGKWIKIRELFGGIA